MLQFTAAFGFGQQSGSIQGTVKDADFDAPLVGAKVELVETRTSVETGARGGYSFPDVAPGSYTLVFSKSGYTRSLREVAVLAGQLSDADAELEGDFTDLDEFVVEPVFQIGGGSELGLLNLRSESPSLLDSISADLMKRSGVSDAGDAVKRIAGATVTEDSTPVVRGLPDRYVPSLVNGVRLPSANEDKRAVELDQFSTAVVESIQIAKTFTPDQQGDGSGGVVNVITKAIPDQPVFSISASSSYNSQVTNEGSFLSYEGGGVGGLGQQAGDRGPQLDNLGDNWEGAVGVSDSAASAPRDYKISSAIGGSRGYDNGAKVGGFLSLYYERDSAFFDNGVDNSLWLRDRDEGLIPQVRGSGSVQAGDFQTALFDIVQGSQQVQWGGTASAGVEFDDHAFGLTYLHSHTAEDRATLAEDTRGKEFYFPGYDPNDPGGPGNVGGDLDQVSTAPYLRTHTLEYTERTTGSLQLRGDHTFDVDPIPLGESFRMLDPELNWVLSSSFADLNQPDKRLFGAIFRPRSFVPGGAGPPVINDPFFESFRPADNVNLGNLQRTFKKIEEDSTQGAMDLKLPFEQWDEHEGYLKFGAFEDRVDRAFTLDNFSNGNDPNSTYFADYGQFWTDIWQDQDHFIDEQLTDVDYDGEINISAWYSMFDMPLSETFNVIGGVRFESTDINVNLSPEEEALWVPPGGTSIANLGEGEGDAEFSSNNALPAISAVYQVTPDVTLRGAYSKTIARQTFKELVPIVQQDFLGGPIFIGNPNLELANLDNYDLRVDYRPSDSTFLSASYFLKHIENPIENIQRVVNFGFTTPVNYPEGELSGIELEARQGLGDFAEILDGFAIGANATFIDSEVTFPDAELQQIDLTGVGFDQTTRDATNAPEFLYNVYMTYDLEDFGTQFGLFYTVQGDTLLAGDSTSQNNFIPAVYQREFGTLNLSIGQRLTKHLNLRIQAKNLTNPTIETVYRSSLLESDATRSSFTRGVEYSIGLSANYSF